MHIKKLHIDNFKCLKDFDIDFSCSDGGNTAILIGENGTGKSSMLEMIIRIFMSIYSLQYNASLRRKAYEYDNYTLEYTYASKNIIIQNKNRRYSVWEDNKQILKNALLLDFRDIMRADSNRLLPMRIISFYSGMNTTIQELNELIYKNYKAATFKALKCYFGIEEGKPYMPTKHFIYCSDKLTPLYLCAFLCCNNQNQRMCLTDPSGIEYISRIRVLLNTKNLSKNLNKAINSEDVEKTLEFLDGDLCKLFHDPTIMGDIYIYSISKFSNWGTDAIDILDFFDRLQTIFNAEIEVDVRINNKNVDCDWLSEGQRQLIKMIGMLGLCRFQDTLVLLDEPDAHMNPRWKYEIYNTIKDVLAPSINTQAIIATHDPLVINGVSKEFIRIFECDDETGTTKVIEPESNTEGMGIDGLLQSEYYGLPTVLDTETKKKLDEKYELMVKAKENDNVLNKKDKQKLEELTEVLEDMTFSRNIPTDIYYDEYVAAMHKIYREKMNVPLSKKDIDERNAKAEEILRGLLGE